MPRYHYQVRDNSGQTEAGLLIADGPDEAARMVRKDGKLLVSLEEKEDFALPTPGRGRRIRRDEVIYFATQLAVMVDTGVPLAEALDSIAEQSAGAGLQHVVANLSMQVKGGVEFSAALESYPRIFSRLFVSLMRASEVSGTMGRMLQRISEYMEQERRTRRQVKGALTYPACMLGFCVLVVAALMVFILPRFEAIYAGKGAILPLPTRMLLGISSGLINHWPLAILGFAGTFVALWCYLHSAAGRMLLDGIRIRLPILGTMYRKSYLARSLRTMATMVSTGVSMLEGLSITAQVAGNRHYERIWLGLAEGVKEGQTLSDQLFQCELVPRTVSQMIAAGEKTGQLEAVMNRVAGFCEDELELSIKTVTSLIEPLMIIIMGVMVGGIAMALLLPIFSMSRVVAQ